MKKANFFTAIITFSLVAPAFLFATAAWAYNYIKDDVPPDIILATTTSITTTTTSVVVTTTSKIEEAVKPPVSDRKLIAEPNIRVGLYKTNEPVKFTSDFVYEVWTSGEFIGALFAQDEVILSYKNGIYTLKGANLTATSSKYIRLVPQDSQAFFALTNYSRPVKGRGKINFNVYRGILEYRFSAKSAQPYIINELPLDFYVQGIAETHDSAHSEYLKALSVAARSYGNAMIGPTTEKRLFDVYATTADQLYLGYNSELFMPKFLKATLATAGEMVTYKGKPVITFYFSRSNGKTKSAGKTRPWLKSVVAKFDKGKTMLGHGIGMSNADAQQRAAKDGWTYERILQHYYTSTTVEKIY